MKTRKSHFARAYFILSLSLLGLVPTHSAETVQATPSTATNIIDNPSFENGVGSNGVPTGWQFNGCEGVGDATVGQDPSQWTDKNNSAKVATGPVTPGGCIAPAMLQSAVCSGMSQTTLTCPFSSNLTNSSLVAFCMGMSGTGGTFAVSDTLSNTFQIEQEVTTNVHVACGYSLTYTQLAYQQSGSDTVTLTFGPNSFNDFAVVYEVLGANPINNSGPCGGSGIGKSFGCSTPITVSGYPFIFSMVASTTPMSSYAAGSNFIATNITSSGATQYGSSPLITTTRCESSNNNNVSYGMACVFMGIKRVGGFSQFSQQLLGYNFTDLTDSPGGFSFWFKLQPYNTNGIAAFEVRIFGAETGAELEYVIDPDPSVGQYSNITSPYFTYSLLFYGYQPGQWYHFSRNLRADWLNLGLPLNYNFVAVQFEGFSTQSGTTLKSETFWLDDVRAYVGTGPIPPSSNWTDFHFEDSGGNPVDNLIQWTLTDSMGHVVPYTRGQETIPPGPYNLQAFYRSLQPSYMILKKQIHLNSTLSVPLAMFSNPMAAGTYAALNDSSASAKITQPNSTALQIVAQGTPGVSYRMLLDLPEQPKLIQAGVVSLKEGYDWTYDAAVAIANINFVMPTGSENFTITFASSSGQSNIVFVALLAATAVVAALGVVVWKRRVRNRQHTTKAPKQIGSATNRQNRNKPRKEKKTPR